jgi:hypothetical protein
MMGLLLVLMLRTDVEAVLGCAKKSLCNRCGLN